MQRGLGSAATTCRLRGRLSGPSAKTPQMFLGTNEESPKRHSGRAVAKLFQIVTSEHIEFVTCLQHHHLPGRRDAVKTSSHIYWGTEKIAPDPFLVTDLAAGRA